jgi:hypothetical protein
MKLGTKTHYCDGSRQPGQEIFGRIVNLYIHKDGKWATIGTMCSNCGDHWINGIAYEVPRPKTRNTGSS